MSSDHYPPSLNHVAVTVPDLDAAVAWYTEVSGFDVLRAGQREPELNELWLASSSAGVVDAGRG